MKPIRNFSEANRALSQFYKYSATDYNLDTMRALMDYLDNPQNKFRTVHVAGTSGKTSTAYYMAALLTASGKKTGLTVSPHVDQLNERVQINGQPISEMDFCQALSEFLDLVKASRIEPSWFEVMVGFAFWYFDRADVDYAVIEVGLGGLLDGTNVIDRDDKICLITDIGLDHIDVLGNSLAKIAAQKIGIVRAGNVVFTYRQTAEIMDVFVDWCGHHSAELKVINNQPDANYQQRNWLLAHEAYKYLQAHDGLAKLDDAALKSSQKIVIPGRMDIRQIKSKTIIMDGAHNAQKMAAFMKSFRQMYPRAEPLLLLSLKEGKEYQKLVPILAGLSDEIIITTFEATQDLPSRSMDPMILAEEFKKNGQAAKVIVNQTEAVKYVLRAPENLVIITGSFYLLSQIRNNGLLDD